MGRRVVWDEDELLAWVNANRESAGGGLMGVQKYVTASGAVRYRSRVKSHGRVVASKVFTRKSDAVAWDQDQYRRLRTGEWLDPRRGRVPLETVAEEWLASRATVKRRTMESDRGIWSQLHRAALAVASRRLDHHGRRVGLDG